MIGIGRLGTAFDFGEELLEQASMLLEVGIQVNELVRRDESPQRQPSYTHYRQRFGR